MLAELQTAVASAGKRASALSRYVGVVRGAPWVKDLAVVELPRAGVYAEVFGGLPMFLRREPRGVEVYNDTANGATDFFRCLRRPKLLFQFQQLHQCCMSMTLDTDALAGMYRESSNRLLRAYAWFRLALAMYEAQEPGLWGVDRVIDYSILGRRDDWGRKLREVLSAVDTALPSLHGRLMRVQYERSSWEKMLRLYDSEETLFWVDAQPLFLQRFGASGPKEFSRVITSCRAKVAVLLWREHVPGFLLGWQSREIRPSLQLVTNF